MSAHWLRDLLFGTSIAQAILLISLVALLGLTLGSIRIRGVGLGIAGVLFAGLAFAHFGFQLDPEVLHFTQELGLILFVYTIGMQVGPGFFASLKRAGIQLNLLASAIVLLGTLIAVGIALFGGVPVDAAIGLLAGATTNTPSLGAAQQALADLQTAHGTATMLPGLGYAIAYPFGVLGIIATMLSLRVVFRIGLAKEERQLDDQRASELPKLTTLNICVRNPNLAGRTISQIPGLRASGVVISRLKHEDHTTVASEDSVLSLGDILLAVGTPERVEEIRLAVGEVANVDLRSNSGVLAVGRIVVTRKANVGRTVRELGLEQAHRVRVTRIGRAEVDLPHAADIRLQIGDTLTIVGQQEDLERVARILGNSMKDLNHPEIIPLFIGIALGVIVGSIPLQLPGIPSPLKLGLAGGPLIVAILLSRVGKFGPLMWYIPPNANFLVREFGIVLFLACVGLRSGGSLVETLLSAQGISWFLWGATITLVPLVLVGIFARMILKLNYLTLCGVLAGSMTDPPALAFSNSFTGSEAPSLSYATVYPLTMLLRVVAAQLVVLFLANRIG
ncbi:MAG: putative transporter [Verrucomicrobiia bacterium]